MSRYKTSGQIEIEAEKYRQEREQEREKQRDRDREKNISFEENDDSFSYFSYCNPCNLVKYLCCSFPSVPTKRRIITPFDLS